jgi:hypothetical protein
MRYIQEIEHIKGTVYQTDATTLSVQFKNVAGLFGGVALGFDLAYDRMISLNLDALVCSGLEDMLFGTAI